MLSIEEHGELAKLTTSIERRAPVGLVTDVQLRRQAYLQRKLKERPVRANQEQNANTNTNTNANRSVAETAAKVVLSGIGGYLLGSSLHKIE